MSSTEIGADSSCFSVDSFDIDARTSDMHGKTARIDSIHSQLRRVQTAETPNQELAVDDMLDEDESPKVEKPWRVDVYHEVKELHSVRDQWVGIIQSVNDSEFDAQLESLHGHDESRVWAKFSIDEVSKEDLPLVEPGASFIWSIIKEETLRGTVRNVAEIEFRRVPSISKLDLLGADELSRKWQAALRFED